MKVNLQLCLLLQISFDEFQVQVVQMTEGGIASGLFRLMCCCVYTSGNRVIMGAPYPRAYAVNGDIGTI
jgi:hypothetical protein